MARLNRTYGNFAKVQLDSKAHFLNDISTSKSSGVTAARPYYAQALQLSLMIIHNQGLAFGGTSAVEVPTLLVKTDDVFEAYIRKTLKKILSLTMPEIRVLDGNPGQPGNMPLFARGSATRVTEMQRATASPDIVLKRKASAPPQPLFPLVIDVKYKDKPPQREDVNQAVVYGVVYGSTRVVLLYPFRPHGQEGDALEQFGQLGGITLYRYFFDLSSSFLEGEGEKLAEIICQRLL